MLGVDTPNNAFLKNIQKIIKRKRKKNNKIKSRE